MPYGIDQSHFGVKVVGYVPVYLFFLGRELESFSFSNSKSGLTFLSFIGWGGRKDDRISDLMH